MPNDVPSIDPASFDATFGALKPLSWRGIQVPAASVELALDQDHAEHKFPDRDGAHIEATGRNPLRFRAKLIFRNNITPGKKESWPSGILYPLQFRAFLEAAADRSSGEFVHPELGPITCKLKSFNVRWDAMTRDGVDADAEWVESTDKPEDLAAIIGTYSAASASQAAAADLDTYAINKVAPFYTPPVDAQTFTTAQPSSLAPPPFEPSFGDAMRQIQGVFDQYTLLSKKAGGQVDHIIYRVNALSDSVASAKDVTMWAPRQSLEKMKSALYELKKQILTSNRKISFYQVPAPTTLAAIAAFLHAPIADLLKLNPLLAQAPSVQPFSIVRYYTAV